MVTAVLLRCKTLDVVADQRDENSLVWPAVEDVMTVHVARVEPGVVGRRELSTTLILTPYVEQTRCAYVNIIVVIIIIFYLFTLQLNLQSGPD